MEEPGKLKGRGAGWRKLRQQQERGFKANFSPLRDAIHRNEFIGSVVELFISGLVGVSKVNFGAKTTDEDNNHTEK